MKILALSILALIMFSFIAGFVLAQTAEDAAQATKGFLSGVKNFAGELFKPFFDDKELLTRALFAVLLYMILYSIISSTKFFKRTIAVIVTILITTIILIALPVNFLTTIRATYGAMGAVILSVIPFVIILVFTIRVKSALAARILWIFFVIYYFSLLIYNWALSGKFISAETIPYLLAVIAGLVIFFLIGSIRKAIFKGEMQGVMEQGERITEKAKVLHKLQGKELKAYTEAGNE